MTVAQNRWRFTKIEEECQRKKQIRDTATLTSTKSEMDSLCWH